MFFDPNKKCQKRQRPQEVQSCGVVNAKLVKAEVEK